MKSCYVVALALAQIKSVIRSLFFFPNELEVATFFSLSSYFPAKFNLISTLCPPSCRALSGLRRRRSVRVVGPTQSLDGFFALPFVGLQPAEN